MLNMSRVSHIPRIASGALGVVGAAATNLNSYLGDTLSKCEGNECRWVDGRTDRWIDSNYLL